MFLVSLLSASVGLSALLALGLLDRALRSAGGPEPNDVPRHFERDLSRAFGFKGATRRVGRAFWKAPLPLFVGGLALTVLDNPAGVPGAALDGRFGGRAPDVPTAVGSGGWMIAAVALGLSCVLVAALLRAWLLPGWIRLQRAALVDGCGDFRTLGSGADRFLDVLAWRILRALLLGLVFVAGMGPAVAIAALAPHPEHPVTVAGFGVGLAVQAALALWVGPGIALAERFLVLDGVGPVEALRRSWNAARGNRPTLILYAFASGLALLASVLLGTLIFCIGAVVTVPWTRALVDLLWTRAWLRGRHGEEAEYAWKGTNAV